MAVGNGGRHLRAQRVAHRGQPEEAQPRLGHVAVVGTLLGRVGRRTGREAEHPQTVGGVALEGGAHRGRAVSVERTLAAVGGAQRRAALEQLQRRSLGVDLRLAAGL